MPKGSGSTPSIYGYIPSANTQNIYGAKASDYGPVDVCVLEDTCMTDILMQQFLDVVESVKQVIAEFFPATTATSSLITKIAAFAFMNDYTYVRFVWISRHPGMIFDNNNITLQYEILDIYLEFGLSTWVNDPLVNTLYVPNR